LEIKRELTTQTIAGGNRQTGNWISKIMERFFEKVQGDWQSGCWNWTGAVDHRNYSRFWCDKNMRGHRWIYAAFLGAIPDGLELDHLCFNPRCVAPYHLEPVTPAENQRRKAFRKAEAEAGRPIRIKTGATTVQELTLAIALGLPVGGVIVLPARLGAQAVRSTSSAPYGTLPMPSRPQQRS
jgi:hypothetical protein